MTRELGGIFKGRGQGCHNFSDPHSLRLCCTIGGEEFDSVYVQQRSSLTYRPLQIYFRYFQISSIGRSEDY